tara:strand:- start:461 stop:4483 length:4023 start_codon:yes stop_codon:yes gene_type:complete
VEYQESPFQPVRSFDWPSVQLQQVLSNSTTLESIYNLALPSRRAYLTPKEQVSLTEKLKEQYGGNNRALRTAIGIATNPWIWVGAAFSPAGATALRKGMPIFGNGANVAKFINKDGSLLDAAGISHADAMLNGTKLSTALEVEMNIRQGFNKYLENVEAETLKNIYSSSEGQALLKGLGEEAPQNLEDVLQLIAKQRGVAKPEKFTPDILDPSYKPRKEHAELAEDIRKLTAIGLSGRQRDTIENIVELSKVRTVHLDDMDIKEGQDFLNALQAKTGKKGFGTGPRETLTDSVIPGVKTGKVYDGAGRYEISQDGYRYLKQQNIDHALANPTTRDKWNINILDDQVKTITTEVELPALMPEDVFDTFADFHTKAIIQSKRAAMDAAVTKLMGDEEAMKVVGGKIFKTQDYKLQTLSGALEGKDGRNLFIEEVEDIATGSTVAKGADVISTIVGIPSGATGDVLASRRKALKSILEKSLLPTFERGTYLPRNTYKSAGSETSEYVLRGHRRNEELGKTSRLTNRVMGGRVYHPEDLTWLKNKLESVWDNSIQHKETRSYLMRQLNSAEKKIKDAGDKAQVLFPTLEGVSSTDRYTRDVSELYARFIPQFKIDPATGKRIHDANVYGPLIQQDDAIKKAGGLPSSGGVPLTEQFFTETPWRSSFSVDPKTGNPLNAQFTDSLQDLIYGSKRNLQPAGGITIADIIANDWHALKNNRAKEFFRDYLLPHVSGRTDPRAGALNLLQMNTRRQMEWFADSFVGQTIEGLGRPGKEFVDSIREMSQARNTQGGLARWLYVGFLGANMSSVMLNMMQPLLHASMWGGLDTVLPAYKNAVSEILDYGSKRFKMGRARISDRERFETLESSFEFINEERDLLGFAPDVFANIDNVTYANTQRYGVESGLKYISQSLPMKLFEKVELLNRNVAAHMVKQRYLKDGVKLPKDLKLTGFWNENEKNVHQFYNDVRRFVSETQFGGNPMNMPGMFLGYGEAGNLMSNSLARMFLSFPLRAATSFLITGKQISPTRHVRGTNLEVPWFIADGLRAMGTGALAYEVGKEMLRTDLSRGLGVSPFFEVMDAGFVPPVVQLPIDLIKTITGDLDFAESSLPALVPGGISGIRAMGMLPKLGEGMMPDFVNNLQKTYVDWDTKTEDGNVPVFSADGRLINYEKPFTIIMRGLGLKIEDHPKAGELDGYLLKQRQQITQLESDYMNALLANNITKAKRIQSKFEKRFGVPLKVSKSQFRSRLRNLETSRTERIADTIPSEYKHLYEQTLQEQSGRLGLTEEQVIAGETSRARTRAGAERTSSVQLNPETVEEIKRHLQSQAQQKEIEEQGFNPFKSWSQ